MVSILNQCRGPCPPVCLSQGQHDRQQQSYAVAGNAYDTSWVNSVPTVTSSSTPVRLLLFVTEDRRTADEVGVQQSVA